MKLSVGKVNLKLMKEGELKLILTKKNEKENLPKGW
jgi:hypothetical protein